MSSLEVRAFAHATDRWARSRESGGALDLDHLCVVTLNTWFEAVAFEERALALIALLGESDADVFCLQEVTPALAAGLETARVVREEMEVVRGEGTWSGYGCMILSRLPIARARELPLDSIMGRSLVVAEIETTPGSIAVSTVHLESTRSCRGTRVTQLGTIFEALAPFERALLTGDFNFDPRDPEEEALDPSYVDVWPWLRQDEPGYTEDTTRNPMRLHHHGKEKHVRYDRVLARMRGWTPTEVELFADEPVGGDVFVSDHFGVRAGFERHG